MLEAALSIQLLIPQSLGRLPVDPLLVKGSTPYHVLQKEFSKAGTVSIRELNGLYSGRCYYFDSPQTPVASLVSAQAAEAKSLGPAFQSADYRRITPLVAPEAESNVFDTLDTKKIEAVQKAVQQSETKNSFPYSSNNSLVVEGMRTPQEQLRSYRLRKSDKYLFLRVTCEENDYCLNTREGLFTNRVLSRGGESNVICYYWKRTHV